MRDVEEIEEVFESYNDDYICEDGIVNRKSNRPDLCAFLILDELFPSSADMVCGADHDVIYLGLSEEQICMLSDDTIHDLVRCGVSIDSDGLYMFV